MSESQPDLPAPQTLAVGSGDELRTIAFRHSTATDAVPPGLVWLGGFKSDMDGSKALALARYAEQHGLGFTRFDYSGHGLSGGSFLDGTISRWLDEAEAVVRATSGAGDQRILVGSSMGGWLALLLNRRLRQSGGPQISGLVLIAPAVDMTADLMWQEMSEAGRAELLNTGRLEKPSDYSDDPYILTLRLIEDGKHHLFGSAIIETGCPVHILQGGLDTDVPPTHALKLASQLPLDDVALSLIPDGDHRLSRPQDLQRLMRSIDTLLEGIAG
uniref:alpha/beta hydrolase n=1 Tax=Pararhizobium sp. IMCC3301 TaxID=3067904 RepID=UPI002740C0A7|nr:alpha/beta hydrolase [Pararhizobium sp. IMCC3301]